VDRIKETLPIWKKEFWVGGGVWLDGKPVEGVVKVPEARL
jgi:molybdopterin synthase catalytic subunit